MLQTSPASSTCVTWKPYRSSQIQKLLLRGAVDTLVHSSLIILSIETDGHSTATISMTADVVGQFHQMGNDPLLSTEDVVCVVNMVFRPRRESVSVGM